jgi:DnaK suppressor protein
MERHSLEQFRVLLQARQSELEREASQKRGERRGFEASESKDEGDLAVSSQTKEMLFRQTSQNAALLRAIRSALVRIENGTFGLCMNCEQEISATRLKAIPWVQYCIICQELIEEQ